VPSNVMKSLAVAAIAVGIVSVLAALTLLPALLGLLGPRVNRFRFVPRRVLARRAVGEGGFWGRLAGAIMRRPLAFLVVAGALMIVVCAVLSASVYRDPPAEAPLRRAAGERGAVAAVLRSRDLWLVASATLVFAAMQTVWMAFLALYLQGVVGLALLAASRYLALAQAGGVLGRVAFGVLSDRTFGGRRRAPLVIAGCGSALCSLAIAFTGPAAGAWLLTPLALVFGFFGIGWNGVQHTLMAEIAGPRSAGTAVGLGLAISSLGVTLGPPVFGACVTAAGGYRGPWIGLSLVMLVGLGLLALVRERPRF